MNMKILRTLHQQQQLCLQGLKHIMQIAVDNDKAEVKTVLEQAKEKGKSTGLVATSEITHATPALSVRMILAVKIWMQLQMIILMRKLKGSIK